ncbi:hypothetical protein [Planctomyces sp. SH-PL14]|uniref:hypothetical protein n=1 Tax=Planctomyces sp. SH-PL14 TaxID=1632864 RepID=UPI00078C78B7|nr:hypothetical protein [Planctomyces sp. SH-PL14]AMV18120.1 hypothetical protein VT03_09540 [Planctomyces sp. SH-PL14]
MSRLSLLLSPVFVVAVCLWIAAQATTAPQPSPKVETLTATNDRHWYKGNLHTHSYWSDGNDFLEMIALWYRDKDYHFLSFTDHNTLAKSERWVDIGKVKAGEDAYRKLKERLPDWIEEREKDGKKEVRLRRFTEVSDKFGIPGKYLLIQGEEISDKFHTHPIHLNAANIQEQLPPLGGDSVYDVMQNNVNAVIAQRERTGVPILVHLNHPNFHYAVTAEDLMRVRGENFFEVYNGHPGVNNSGDAEHASMERIWDIVLTLRLTELNLPLMYGLAVDDGHAYHNIPSRASEPGRGWVQVLATELTPEALIASLEAGRFYSSCGVRMRAIGYRTDGIDLEVEPDDGAEYTIEFMGTRRGTSTESEPVLDKKGEPVHATRRYAKGIGEVFQTSKGTSAQYRFQGDELYVRARVTSSLKHPNPSEIDDPQRAWIQPVLGPAAK